MFPYAEAGLEGDVGLLDQETGVVLFQASSVREIVWKKRLADIAMR